MTWRLNKYIETSRHWGENWWTLLRSRHKTGIMITKPPTNPGACIPSRQPNDPTSTNPATVGKARTPCWSYGVVVMLKWSRQFQKQCTETKARTFEPNISICQTVKAGGFQEISSMQLNCEFTFSHVFSHGFCQVQQIQPAEPASSAPALLEPA